jgi:hypothetical protein
MWLVVPELVGSDLKLRITIDLVSVDYRGSGKRQKSASEMTFHGIFLFLEYSCQGRSWLPNLTTPALTLHNGTNSSVESLFTLGRQIQLHEQTVNPSAAQMQGDREGWNCRCACELMKKNICAGNN